MTFNIRYGTARDGDNSWQYRRQALFKQIADKSPDIAGLQEALEFQVQEICRALPEYGSIGIGRDDGKKEGEQCCILYRRDRLSIMESGTFWFSDTPQVPGSKSWGNTLPRICTWVKLRETQSGNKFYVFNVHLDHLSDESRIKSVELLANRIWARQGKEPFIVTGDFNCGPDSLPMRYLLGQAEVKSPEPMVDVLAEARPDLKNTGTYHAFEGGTDGARIDFILTGPGARILEAQIGLLKSDGRFASDHFPVMARLGVF